MHDFPGNSQKAKARAQTPPPPPEERPKVERVTTSKPEQRKRGLGRKFRETLIGGTARETAEYMVQDVVVPAVRDMIFDAFESGLHRLIYGESNRTRSNMPSSYSNVGHVNYQGMSTSRPTATHQTSERKLSRRSRSRHDFGEIIIENRREADDVLELMFEYLDRFGEVKVADLYEMTGIASSHVDHKWGWTSLQGAKLVRTRDGRFLLDLPEPSALD